MSVKTTPPETTAEDAPSRRSRHFGPSNAAGFGGWLGVALPLLPVAAWVYGTMAIAGGIDAETILVIAGSQAFAAAAAVVPGYFAGWAGGAVVGWVRRRRRADWGPCRSDFPAGVAAGSLLAAGTAVALAVLNA